tara:strand:+ start:303 stop:554 length:252 start_codon:yes stop_codon:yes gene_type:complete
MGRDYKKEYENYHSSPKQKKRRAARNKARSLLEKKGLVHKGDGKDVHHKDGDPSNFKLSNLSVQKPSTNRSFPRNKNAGKKYA